MAIRPLSLSELGVAIGTTSGSPAGPNSDHVNLEKVAFCGDFLTIQGDKIGLIH